MCSGGQRTVCWNGEIRSLGLRNNDEMACLCSVRGGLARGSADISTNLLFTENLWVRTRGSVNGIGVRTGVTY